MPFLVDKVVDAAFIVIVALLYFTDWIDGFVSRKCGVQTLFGSIMDTVADKVLCIILIICIPNKHWILYTMMVGEILIAVMNSLGVLNGATLVAIMLGKAKMWALAIVTILGYMHYFNICNEIFVLIPAVIVIIMQVIVLFEYGSRIQKIKQVRQEKVKYKKGKELAYALFNTEYYLSTLDEPLLKKLTV